MKIKSHTYISKSILNRFCTSNDKGVKVVNYIDFNELKVKEQSPKKFMVEEGYFSSSNEKRMANDVENKIGNIIKKINTNILNNTNFELTDKEQRIIKKYAAYQLIKDDELLNFIKDLFDLNNNFPYSNKHYILLLEKRKIFNLGTYKDLKNIFIEVEKEQKTFLGSVEELAIIVHINKTPTPFLITNSIFDTKKGPLILLKYTLTPQIAISLFKKKFLSEKLKTNESYFVDYITDEHIIKKYNENIFFTAKQNFPNILVGEKKELNRLLKNNFLL